MIRSVHVGSLLMVMTGWVLATACSSDEQQAALRAVGAEGESCTAKADCADSLACINNVCVSASAGTMAGVDGGDASVTIVVSQQGESCAARSDCALGLVCIHNVCTSPSQVMDAGTQTGVGQRGESCSTHSDCASGLGCYNGQCGPSNYGLTPTGKSCVSVACSVAKDCCPTQASASTCATYKSDCDISPAFCDTYKLYCMCDGSQYACVNDQCQEGCMGDAGSTCPGGQVCDGTKCVACIVGHGLPDRHAEVHEQSMCRALHEGHGLHVLPSVRHGNVQRHGCKTDRECVAYAQNVSRLGANALLAKCDAASTKCKYPVYGRRGLLAGGQRALFDAPGLRQRPYLYRSRDATRTRSARFVSVCFTPARARCAAPRRRDEVLAEAALGFDQVCDLVEAVEGNAST